MTDATARPASAAPERPKRVLYVENGIGYGGAVICLRHLVRHLDRSRFEPLVVTGRGGPLYEDIAGDAAWRHIRDRRLDTRRLRERLDASVAGRVPGLAWLARQLLARSDDLVNFLPFFLGLLATALRFRPDIVHANNEPLCNRAALLVAKLLGAPAVCHVRGNLAGSRLMRWAYRLPDRLLCVSRWVAESLDTLGVPESRRTVVYDGLEFDLLDRSADGAAFRARHGVADGEFAVGLVGLLIPWKGQALFLEAGRRLVATIPGLRLLIVGGTPDECRPYEAELRARVRALGLERHVVFTGHEGNVAEVYRGLDVVVSASTDPEPLGTMVIEAMAMGRPLVAPAHGGAMEMVSDGETGLLFKPRDATDLARAIARLHAEPALREALGAAAHAHARATFDVARHARAVMAEYDALLGSRAPALPAAGRAGASDAR